MKLLLIGTGNITTRLGEVLREHGHSLEAAMASFIPAHIELFDFTGIIVVSPEGTVTPESLVQAAERGKHIYLFAGAADGLAAWASASGVLTFAYPPSEVETSQLLEELRRAEAGVSSADDAYRRIVLGGDFASKIQSGMVARKIAVTSPKGGAGKTTVAVNLAVCYALAGITTYLVDADIHAGAMQYHLRMKQIKTTMIQLLRQRASAPPSAVVDTMRAIASGGAFLDAFTTVDALPTLKVLPGLVTDDLADPALQNIEIIEKTIAGLYEAGVASGGIVIMDVGINPSQPVHRAALNYAEAIAIVIKPEIPDVAETRRWISRMIKTTAMATNQKTAVEFIGSRVKLCYNMIIGDGFKKAHHLLQQALQEDNLGINLVPNGILPFVDPHLANVAVNGDSVQDILIWRYKVSKLEELAAFTEAILGFASHFVPSVTEGAARIGLLPGSRANGKKPSLFSKMRG
jgi:MinD-like ATPase involved in chromosome partitioning or flagellar assembly